MAPRQLPAAAWYSSALDSPNVSEASLAGVHQLAAAQGVDGAKVFKAGFALLEGQGSTYYPLFVSAIVAGLVPPFLSSSSLSSTTITFKLCTSIPTLFFSWRFLLTTVRLMSG